jgi:Na+-translocating ferredoxin:NAD+ oxidoreductase subunit G
MDTKREPERSGSAWRSALALGLVAAIGTALLAGVNQATRQRIQDQERRAILKQLGELITSERYDNALHDDHYSFTNKAWFPSGQAVTVYRARRRAEPVAAVLRLVATDGYNGNIHLLIGINADGSLSGVRVTSHKETPGLGDAIDTAKSDWVLGFSGRSLQNPQQPGWAVKRDGGEFDQFTGATITPRAVVKAVRMALEFYAANKDTVFEQPSDTPEPARS